MCAGAASALIANISQHLVDVNRDMLWASDYQASPDRILCFCCCCVLSVRMVHATLRKQDSEKKQAPPSAVVCITCALGMRLMCAGAASAVIVNISQHKFI